MAVRTPPIPLRRPPKRRPVFQIDSAVTSAMMWSRPRTRPGIALSISSALLPAQGWVRAMIPVAALSRLTACETVLEPTAPIASALAVELFVVSLQVRANLAAQGVLVCVILRCVPRQALLHHPAGNRAPADGMTPVFDAISDEHKPLGLLPHQVRGYLTHHAMVLPKVRLALYRRRSVRAAARYSESG